jgi:hypothetical protein
MQRWIPFAMTVAIACGAAPTPLQNRRGVARLGTVYVAPPGIFIDGKFLGSIPQLRARPAGLIAALDRSDALGHASITFDLRTLPASIAIDALRLFTGRTLRFRAGHNGPACAGLRLHDHPNPRSSDAIRVSVLLDDECAWIGISRVGEFQAIRDVHAGHRDVKTLGLLLRKHKASVFFEGRRDLELAARAGSAADVAGALAVACGAGFTDITLVAPDQLSAVPAP